ncbi:MAG: AMP-binding protein [Planctomycetota bacterium]
MSAVQRSSATSCVNDSNQSLASSLLELLKVKSEQSPHAIALFSPDRRPLEYGRLLEEVEYVGRTLRGIGVRGEDAVAIILPNGPEMATAFLGTASFACCAPLNPQYGADEFRFYLNDLGARAIIIAEGDRSPARQVATELGLTILELSPEPSQTGVFRFLGATSVEDGSVIDGGTAEDIALVLHTSGTTSKPKIVPLSHRNLLASAHHIQKTLQLTPTDRCLNVMPLFHIHGLVGCLLSSLAAGSSIIATGGFDASSFPVWLTDLAPTWYSAVPTIHQSVLNCMTASSVGRGKVSLRFIRSSSSALPPPMMRDLEATFGVPVIESYGMTEAAHQMASNPLPPATRKPGSVGLPAGPEMGIMDDEGNLIEQGSGEIVIRGPNVTQGYRDNPDANATSFTHGWFRTGDLGYFDDDGYLVLSGRKKEMINRGGEKVSPREIDEALLEAEGVAQAVAFAVPHPTLGEDIAAAVVAKTGSPLSERVLRRYLHAKLSAHKVPSRILVVDAIPKGPTGKLQRIGLHEKLARAFQGEHVEPRTELEAEIAAVFAEILGIERVGATDNFFFLGGDSLKGMRVIARISANFQFELSAVTLFLNPTPEELAIELTRSMGEASGMLEDLLAEIENMSDEEIRQSQAGE